MKRLLSSIVIISLLIAIVILPIKANPSVAENDLSITKTLDFQSEDSDKTAENRLEKFALFPKLKKLMLDRFPDKISSADTISIKTDFYVQENNGTLSQVTESDYEAAVKEQKQKISENERRIKADIEKTQKSRSFGSMNLDWEDRCFLPAGNRRVIDKGTLKLVFIILSEGKSFFCVGLFQWDTMPKSRYTDAFGLTRNINTTVDGKSENGYFEYKRTSLYLSGDKYVTDEKTIGKELGFNDLKLNSDGYGYAYDFELMPDVRMAEYPYTSVVYSDLTGFLCFEGWLNDNASQTDFQLAYAHQKLGITFGGIEFSRPYVRGFSPKFAPAYEQLEKEYIWTK